MCISDARFKDVKGLRVTKTGPPQCDSCDWLSGCHGSQTNKMVRCDCKKTSKQHIHRCREGSVFQPVKTELGDLSCYVVLLICPSSEKSRPPPGGQRRGESLGGPRLLCLTFVLLYLGIHALFSQRRLAQDLGRSQSCCVDWSTSDMPISTPLMIEVSESLLSGGWCSLLAMMWLSPA